MIPRKMYSTLLLLLYLNSIIGCLGMEVPILDNTGSATVSGAATAVTVEHTAEETGIPISTEVKVAVITEVPSSTSDLTFASSHEPEGSSPVTTTVTSTLSSSPSAVHFVDGTLNTSKQSKIIRLDSGNKMNSPVVESTATTSRVWTRDNSYIRPVLEEPLAASGVGFFNHGESTMLLPDNIYYALPPDRSTMFDMQHETNQVIHRTTERNIEPIITTANTHMFNNVDNYLSTITQLPLIDTSTIYMNNNNKKNYNNKEYQSVLLSKIRLVHQENERKSELLRSNSQNVDNRGVEEKLVSPSTTSYDVKIAKNSRISLETLWPGVMPDRQDRSSVDNGHKEVEGINVDNDKAENKIANEQYKSFNSSNDSYFVESMFTGDLEEENIKPTQIPTLASNTFSINDVNDDNITHVSLDSIEMELSHQKEKSSSDLLLAISILQHHFIPKGEMNDTYDNLIDSRDLLKNDSDINTKIEKKVSFVRNQEKDEFTVEILPTSPSYIPSTTKPKKLNDYSNTDEILMLNNDDFNVRKSPGTFYKWFVLVLDGNCSVIKNRMNAFVTYLKAALAAKLDIEYDEINVPSVFCDITFMVNISLDIQKHKMAESNLRSLAQANTTMLEISGEIFYLEKILTKRKEESGSTLMLTQKPDDLEIVIYIAVGCMCVFILISVLIISLIKVCKQDDETMIPTKILHPRHAISLDFPVRRPNIIYSSSFSQSLNPEKYDNNPIQDIQPNNHDNYCATPNKCGLDLNSSMPYSIETIPTSGSGFNLATSPMSDTHSSLVSEATNENRSRIHGRKKMSRKPDEEVILEEDLDEMEEEDDDESDDDVDEFSVDDDDESKLVRTQVGHDPSILMCNDVVAGIDNPCYFR